MPTQPSILVMMKKRLKSAIRQYIAAKEKMDDFRKANPYDDEGWEQLRDRERLLRGVVRGCAMMYLCVATPAEASNKDSINDLEVDYGFPGERSKPRARASEVGAAFLREYYGED